MTNFKNLFLFLILSPLSSCVYNHTASTEDLGDQYFYLGDGHESQILLGNEQKNTGITIVPQEVIEYDFDKRYIIAKNISYLKNIERETFWIIDKQSKDSVMSFDSISFLKKVKDLNIKLHLKERK